MAQKFVTETEEEEKGKPIIHFWEIKLWGNISKSRRKNNFMGKKTSDGKVRRK